MSSFDLLLQQLINGLSLGSMYALLALGFTIVYGILELINFSHFNVFMIGSFVAMGVLSLFGLDGQSVMMHGAPLVGVLADHPDRHHGRLRLPGRRSSNVWRCARCAACRGRWP